MPSPVVPLTTEIPVPLTRFVGRDRELDELTRLLTATRLLTLTGPGGSGKSRLAREVALRAAAAVTRSAWIDLAPLADPALLDEAVAAALQVPDRSERTPVQALIAAMAAERVLIVLDNCEHLVDACARLADTLLRSCPGVAMLATSREALGVGGETAWLVPPLETADAVQLFVDRAAAAMPQFALTTTNEAAVREICRRLDGIPLALELAAARVRVLSPDQIAARLDDAFRLLASPTRNALPRHRTLRATMEWSHGLLSAREQLLFRRLAVFAGSFTLDAAEAVCAGGALDAEDILDGIAALADKSLVVLEPDDAEARYRLLDTIRQYGVERLAESGELDAMHARHAEYYLAVVEEAAPALVGGCNTPPLLARLARDRDDLRGATLWATSHRSRAELAMRLTGAQFWLWYAFGEFREARQLVDRALAFDAPVEGLHRGGALVSSALTALAQGDYALSIAHFEAALPLLEPRGDRTTVGAALAKLGAARMLGGDLPAAVHTLDAAIALTESAPPHDIAAIFARYWRGWAAYAEGEHDLAYRLLARNVAIARERDMPTSLAHALATLARVELARGRVEDACALIAEALEREVAIGDPWGIGLVLDVVALVAARRGRPEDAARLLGAVKAHRERHGVALGGLAPQEHAELTTRLQEALGAGCARIFAAGLAMSSEEAVAIAFAEAARHTTEQRAVPLPVPPPARRDVRARLSVRALGPLQVAVGERLVDTGAWGSARPRELLVHLLMHPEGRTREQVGLAFWPDASATQLRNNFHVTLHRLRKALGGSDWVTLTGDRYRVDPELVAEFDALAFERETTEALRTLRSGATGAAGALDRALARYRGDFLDGEPAGDWHLEHRERFQRLYVDGLLELGNAHLLEHRAEKAADAYRRVLARDELHEEALLALMRCYAGLGERAQALRAYRRFADRLRDELAAHPGADAARLFEQLQGGGRS